MHFKCTVVYKQYKIIKKSGSAYQANEFDMSQA